MDGWIGGMRKRGGEWEQEFCCLFSVPHVRALVLGLLSLSLHPSVLLLLLLLHFLPLSFFCLSHTLLLRFFLRLPPADWISQLETSYELIR